MKATIHILIAMLLLCTTAMATDYPTDVTYSTEDGVYEIRKYYALSATDEPTTEATEGFVLDGVSYSLVDMLKQELPQQESRAYEETVTVESASKELEDVLPLLADSKEIVTEDGFVGVATLDSSSIAIEAAGYKTSSWTVTASRTYPNLSSMDLQYLPTTIEDQGRTLTLSNVDWQTDNTYNADDYAIGDRYTAIATYSGTASSKSVTGYTVTALYQGTVEKISLEDVRYVAIFRGTALPVVEDTNTMDWRYLAIPLGIIALCGVGFGISKIRQRKGENTDDETQETDYQQVSTDDLPTGGNADTSYPGIST